MRVETADLITMSTGEYSFRPVIGGMGLEEKSWPTPEEAIKRGEELQREYAEETKDIPPIDVVGLHLDGRGAFQADDAAHAQMRPDAILSLGLVMCDEEFQTDAFEEFVDDMRSGSVHFSLKTLAKRFCKNLKDLEKEKHYHNEMELLLDAAESLGYYGFIILASTPIIVWGPDGKSGHGCGFGHYASQWVYGDDFDQAWERAVQWAIDFDNEQKEKAKKKGEKK